MENWGKVVGNSLAPGNLIFYVGAVITRSFQTDEHNLVYSNYSIKTDKGEIYEHSDRNITKKEWNDNREYLPDLFNKAGVKPDTPCRVFPTEEQLDNYMTYHNKVETLVEKS